MILASLLVLKNVLIVGFVFVMFLIQITVDRGPQS